MGNKGGVAVWFRYKTISLIFINCHLAGKVEINCLAGHKSANKRNDDFRRINNDLHIFNASSLFKNGFNHHFTVTDNFDFSFLMGDLNYRLDTELEVIDNCFTSNKVRDLLKYDQLTNERMSGRLEINSFKEDAITFIPTYKYIAGDTIYTYEVDGKRPGWTDRILYKCLMNNDYDIKAIKYDSIMDICLSDHKPVYALFEVNLYEKNNNNVKRNTIQFSDCKMTNVSNSKTCSIY
jgi:hypothetical protein